MSENPPPQPPVYSPAPYAAPTTNGYAIAALVLGILGICCGLLGIVGLVFGYVGKGQIERSGGTQTGNGMAIAGIVLGWIAVAWIVIWILLAATGHAWFHFHSSSS